MNKQGRQGKLSAPYLKYQKQNLETIKKVFSVKELKQISDIFTYFDRQGTKSLKREDLPFALRALGYLITTIEVREMAAYLDPKKTQKIDFEQFLTACFYVHQRKPDEKEVFKALKLLDPKNSNLIQVQDLKKLLMSMGDLVTQQEFETVISELDIRDGKVLIDDLVELLTI